MSSQPWSLRSVLTQSMHLSKPTAQTINPTLHHRNSSPRAYLKVRIAHHPPGRSHPPYLSRMSKETLCSWIPRTLPA